MSIWGPDEFLGSWSLAVDAPYQVEKSRSFACFYWPEEAIKLLAAGVVTEISLDHDLGDDARGTGYDVILWIEEAVALREFIPPTIWVHSANSSAAQKMRAGIESIERLGTR